MFKVLQRVDVGLTTLTYFWQCGVTGPGEFIMVHSTIRGVYSCRRNGKMDTFKSRIRNKNYPAKAEFGRKGRNRIPWNIPFPLIESKSKGKAKWVYELSFSFHLKMIPPPQLVLFFDIIHCRLCTRYTRSCTSFYKHVLRPLCLNFGLAYSFEETAKL